MSILYKFTNGDMQTYLGFKYTLGEKRTAPGGGRLCTSAWLHAYRDPILGVLMLPIHAGYDSPRLFRAEGEVGVEDGTKVGCSSLTLLEEIVIPIVTTEQRVRFAIMCALKACELEECTPEAYPDLMSWARQWLAGNECTHEAAAIAFQAAVTAHRAAAEAEQALVTTASAKGADIAHAVHRETAARAMRSATRAAVAQEKGASWAAFSADAAASTGRVDLVYLAKLATGPSISPMVRQASSRDC